MEGDIEAKNTRSGEKVVIKCTPREGNENSKVTGKGFDAQGNHVLDIYGSWMNDMYIKDLRTGKEELVWQEPAMMVNAHLQYFYNNQSIRLNQVTDGMKGIIAPTDSRWRKDVRFWEEGNEEESDRTKIEIEVEQRRKRKVMEEEKTVWKPLFFEEVTHPHDADKVMWRPI